MLNNLYQKGIVYDCETYKNLFMVSFYSKKKQAYLTYSIFPPYYDEREQIIKLLNSDRIFIGFNNWYFDDGLMQELILKQYLPGVELAKHLFDFGQQLIHERQNPHKHSKKFKSYDLLEVIREGFSVKSLKGVGINLCHDKIQDLPLPIDKEISYSDFNELKSYNINDLVITDKIFEFVKDRLEMREGLAKEYKLPALLSASDSAIAKKLFNKFYVEKLLEKYPNIDLQEFKKGRTVRGDIAMKDIIYERISFKTPLLRDYLENLKTLTINKTESTPTSDTYKCDIPQLKYGGNTYTVGLGGIHSEDEPGIFEAKDGMVLLDVDISSQYPVAMINNSVCPAHLDKSLFTPLLKEIVDRRLEYKRRKKEEPRFKVLEAGLKISINTLRSRVRLKAI